MLKFLKFGLVFLMFSTSSFAKFAVINMKQIEDEAVVTKNLKEQITKSGAQLEADVADAKTKIEKKVADLQKASAALSPDALEKHRNELQKEFVSIEGKLQEQDLGIQEARNKALETINEKVKEISKKIAEKEDYEAVFTSAFLVYYSAENDITKEVISALNKEMKTVEFKVNTKQKKK